MSAVNIDSWEGDYGYRSNSRALTDERVDRFGESIQTRRTRQMSNAEINRLLMGMGHGRQNGTDPADR